MRNRSSLLVVAVIAGIAGLGGRADAGPKRKRAPRADLAAAVASGEPLAMCRAAIAASDGGEQARASLVLPACDDPAAAELAAGAARARRAVTRASEREAWSPVELVLRPAGVEATLTIDVFAGLPLREGRYLLPAGTYRITAHGAHGDAGYALSITGGSRALVMIEVPTEPARVSAGLADFTEDEPTAPMAGPPPVIRHGSLLPERFRRGLGKVPTRP